MTWIWSIGTAGGSSAFLSSGTWSLLGTEVSAPIINARARQLNFTNEGGVCGTTRLLKNAESRVSDNVTAQHLINIKRVAEFIPPNAPL